MNKEEPLHWFALTVFKEFPRLLEDCKKADIETYRAFTVIEEYPKGKGLKYKEIPLIPHLLFVRCTETQLLKYKQDNNTRFMYYRDLTSEKSRPAAIDDRQMEVFMLVTSTKSKDVRALEEDKPEYHQGQKVRVIGGLYKGAEGYIKRIKRSRDLIVSIQGVAVVAISNIHPQFLEPVEEISI